MKKIVAMGVVAVALLAGCATTTSSPTQTVTLTQAAPAPVQTVNNDDEFLQVVRSRSNIYVNQMSDAEVLNLGGQVCPILNSGTTVKQLAEGLVQGLTQDGITDPEAFAGLGIIVGAAINVYCPQYSSQLQSL